MRIIKKAVRKANRPQMPVQLWPVFCAMKKDLVEPVAFQMPIFTGMFSPQHLFQTVGGKQA